MKIKTLRIFSIFWTLFIGIGAFAGGSAMLIDKSGALLGMDAMLPFFQVLPFAEYLFQDFLFSGIALIIVNGITQIAAFVLLVLKNRNAAVWTGICGVILMLWICIQFVIFEFNFMSTSYFIFGLIEAVMGFALYRKEKA